jgi:adenosylcobyric acid synthase
MVLGTASHVGKSLIATAFCRLLAECGVRVAPFKAQNMALNSFVTRDGGEIGRAQVTQAEAAGIEPTVEMNPVLLKPSGGLSQVVVMGEPIGLMSARDYYSAKGEIWPRVAHSYDELAKRFEVIVLEGAGSPVEINLVEHDLTNLRMADHADASIVLVADIERGGAFAHLIGTWMLLPEKARKRVIGFIINKFRGDVSLLDSGLEQLRDQTGIRVLGVLPYRGDLQVDQEDSLGVAETATPLAGDHSNGPTSADLIDVAVVRLPHISNFTDFLPLSRVPGIRVRYVSRPGEVGAPSLLILPGTKATILDLDWLRETGLAEAIVAGANDPTGPVILGICGGFQMLGQTVEDPCEVESSRLRANGLGLLAVSTEFRPEKHRHRVTGRSADGAVRVVGYEIHMGETTRPQGLPYWFELTREPDGVTILDGVAHPSGRLFGTYVHGLFDSLSFLGELTTRLRTRRGLPPLSAEAWARYGNACSDRFRLLSHFLHEHLDLAPIWDALGLQDGGRPI